MADSKIRQTLRIAAALLFLVSGVMHFARTPVFEKIVPPYLPAHRLLVYLSGAAEIAGALGLLAASTRRAAGWGLTALLIAVFPANLYMAMQSVQVTEKPLPQAFLWARLPLQLILIWWVLFAAGEHKVDPDSA